MRHQYRKEELDGDGKGENMIIKCHRDDCWRIKIGSKLEELASICDFEGKSQDARDQPMIVSREVTRKDFEDYITSNGYEVWYPERLHEFRFFEVLTD